MSDPTQATQAGSVAHPPATATASIVAPDIPTRTAPPEPSEGHAPVTREDSRSSSPSAEKSEGFPRRTESPTSDAPDHLAVWVQGMKLRYPPKPALTITAGIAASSAAPASIGAAGDASEDQGLTKFPELERRSSDTKTPSPTFGGLTRSDSFRMDETTLVRRDSLKVPSPSDPNAPRSRQGSITKTVGPLGIATGEHWKGGPIDSKLIRRNSMHSDDSAPGSPTRSRPGSRRVSRTNSLLSPSSPNQPNNKAGSTPSSRRASTAGADTAPSEAD